MLTTRSCGMSAAPHAVSTFARHVEESSPAAQADVLSRCDRDTRPHVSAIHVVRQHHHMPAKVAATGHAPLQQLLSLSPALAVAHSRSEGSSEGSSYCAHHSCLPWCPMRSASQPTERDDQLSSPRKRSSHVTGSSTQDEINATGRVTRHLLATL